MPAGLASRGYTVLQAANGQEAVEAFDGHAGKIDLVVSDVVMPEMDGPTLLTNLRSRDPDVKIIFVSGYAEEAFEKNLAPEEECGHAQTARRRRETGNRQVSARLDAAVT